MDIIKEIEEAEMILVGLGEEFDCLKELRTNASYIQLDELLCDHDMKWLTPAALRLFRGERLKEPLEKLRDILKDKYYFVISTSVAKEISEIEWKKDRYVCPLGCGNYLQCIFSCSQTPTPFTEIEQDKMNAFFEHYKNTNEIEKLEFGICPVCGKQKILHSIYAGELFDERAASSRWNEYTRWLQGSLNRKILLLELGVGMQFPTVIRMPFEKVAALNKKAKLVRINETIPYIPEELSEKGIAIKQNAIAWLDGMC